MSRSSNRLDAQLRRSLRRSQKKRQSRATGLAQNAFSAPGARQKRPQAVGLFQSEREKG
jgi:hypothetical protein